MPNKRVTDWSPAEEDRLATLYSFHASSQKKWDLIGAAMGKSAETCRSHWRLHGVRLSARLRVSPYPRYDEPLTMEGDALVIPDPEFPFHHADFINRCLDLAQAWKIENCIIGGDLLHFNSLSDWEANWVNPDGHGGLDDEQERVLVEFAKTLGSRQQEKLFGIIEDIGPKQEAGDPNISQELRVARSAVKSLSECFKNVDVVIGNHEGRLLRSLHSPMFATEITQKIDAKNWRIAPYYFSYLVSNGETFRIEHPRSASKSAAENLAAKFQCHVLMCHSHALRMAWDISGNFYAFQIGHTVDESRLPYAAQRSSVQPAHLYGACLVREGTPWLLHERSDWKRLEKL